MMRTSLGKRSWLIENMTAPPTPQTCREFASRCAELAQAAESKPAQLGLSNLAEDWLAVAAELEGASGRGTGT